MSGSLETLLCHVPSKPNMRIPPIARAHAQTQTKRSSSPLPCRMATVSRSKLQQESASKDPDLRRCLGHHRLLRRSIQEAQADIQKYMATVRDLEDDEDDEDDDSEDDEFYFVQPARGRSGSGAVVGVVTRVEAGAQADTTTTTTNSGVVIREQIANVVRGMIKRRIPAVQPSAPAITTTTTTTMTTTTTTTTTRQDGSRSNHNLRRVSSKNNSTVDISSTVPECTENGLEKVPTSSSATHTPGVSSSITSRGRRYVSRLGFRRRWPPSAPLQSVASY